jgi:hypothetical protein
VIHATQLPVLATPQGKRSVAVNTTIFQRSDFSVISTKKTIGSPRIEIEYG